MYITNLLKWGNVAQYHMHAFVLFTIFVPFSQYFHKLVQPIRRENDQSRKDGGTLRVQSKDKLSADAKVATASENSPEQFRIFGLAKSQRRAIGRDKSRLSCQSSQHGDSRTSSSSLRAYLEDIVNDEAVLTREEAVTPSEEKP